MNLIKKNTSLLMIALMATMLGFSSCSKDDNDDEGNKGSFTANGKSSSLNWAEWESNKSYDDSYNHSFYFYQDDATQYSTPITYTNEYGTYTDVVLTKRPPNNYGGFWIKIKSNSLSIAGTYEIDENNNSTWSEIMYNWKKEYDDDYKVDVWDYYSSYDSDATSGTLTIKKEGNSYTFSFKGKGVYREWHDNNDDNDGYTNQKENINIEMNYTGEFNNVEHSDNNSHSTSAKSAKQESGKQVMKFRKVGE